MSSIETTDRDEAAAALDHSFPGLRVVDDPDGRPFVLRHSNDSAGMFTYARLTVQGIVTTSGIYPHSTAVARKYAGSVRISYSDRRVDTTRPYLRPFGESLAVFDNSDAEIVIVDPAEFAVSAAAHLEGTGLRYRQPDGAASTVPSLRAARLWSATADAVASAITTGASELHLAALRDLVTASMLSAFQLTVPVARPSGLSVRSKALMRAIQYIDEHLGEPITIPMVAAEARISVRTLQDGFRRQLGETPAQYLRRARLDAAHRELLAFHPGQTSVANTAQRWGFGHVGRFAAAYFEAFGEKPGQTLRG